MNAPIDTAILRKPPHSVESEQSVLGCLLFDNACFDRAADMLRADDFYRPEHRLIFGAIEGLVGACKPADPVTVFERLEAGGKADACGGLAYLNAMQQSVPSAANVRRYAEVVRERALHRRLIHAADEIATAAFNPQDRTAAEIIDAAAETFDRLARVGQPKAPKAVGDLLCAALDRYSDLAAGNAPPGTPTRFRQLDKLLGGGLKPGKVYCIAARPSIGKSSSARSIAINVAKAGKTVLFLSQEMPQDEQIDCLIAELGRIDNERLQTGQFEQEDWTRLTEAAEEAHDLPLLFDEQGALTIADIRAKARGVKGLGLLVVDYLQLCSSTLKGKTTNDEVAEISKGLKALALDLRVPVLVLSQLNREVEKRADKEPMLADLRDSGAIEQDIDVAVLLWTVEEHESASARTVGFKVAKHRGGPKGRFAMRFQMPTYHWLESDFPQRNAEKPRRQL